jgi:hypothetical protein
MGRTQIKGANLPWRGRCCPLTAHSGRRDPCRGLCQVSVRDTQEAAPDLMALAFEPTSSPPRTSAGRRPRASESTLRQAIRRIHRHHSTGPGHRRSSFIPPLQGRRPLRWQTMRPQVSAGAAGPSWWGRMTARRDAVLGMLEDWMRAPCQQQPRALQVPRAGWTVVQRHRHAR